ncbi:hypothetical protein Tco_0858387 [Tanacetum coccineum]|uniref:Uncharacterized protein n=1 Tax=Tanacetum coccineum TaxID=301880 RepID=A0ABQ5B947_9ASTR
MNVIFASGRDDVNKDIGKEEDNSSISVVNTSEFSVVTKVDKVEQKREIGNGVIDISIGFMGIRVMDCDDKGVDDICEENVEGAGMELDDDNKCAGVLDRFCDEKSGGKHDEFVHFDGKIEDLESLDANGFWLKVLGEICEEDVEVKGIQSKNSKEDDKNKKSLPNCNYNVKKVNGYVLCGNRGMSKVAWKPLVKMRMNGSIMGESSTDRITRNHMVTDKPLFGKFVKNSVGDIKKEKRFEDDRKNKKGMMCDIWKWPNRKKKYVLFDIWGVWKCQVLHREVRLYHRLCTELKLHRKNSGDADYVVIGINESVVSESISEVKLVFKGNTWSLLEEHDINNFKGIWEDSEKMIILLTHVVSGVKWGLSDSKGKALSFNKNGVNSCYWELSGCKWRGRKKTCGIFCQVKNNKWKFDIWRWPKRKKKLWGVWEKRNWFIIGRLIGCVSYQKSWV